MSNPAPSREAASKGGSANTPAKKKALEALHKARKGRRVNLDPEDEPQLRLLLRELSLAIARGKHSKRGIAAKLQVSDRTVRRWLIGEDWPAAEHLEPLRAAVSAAK